MDAIVFPSIEQYRNIVNDVKSRAKNHNQPLPTLKFHGTVKLHGSNLSVVKLLSTGKMFVQSRNAIITPVFDHYNFAHYVSDNQSQFDLLCNIAVGVYGNNNIMPGDVIVVYGEWCGKGINKGAGICYVKPRQFIVFGIRVKSVNDTEDLSNRQSSSWFMPHQLDRVAARFKDVKSPDTQIHFINDFKTWEIEIDFNRPDIQQNTMIDITNEVEANCPVSSAFGVNGIGEGVVWSCISDWNYVDGNTVKSIRTSDLIFKVKGKKHSDTKVKKLVSVDVEKMNSAVEFATNTVTDHRLEKIIVLMNEAGLAIIPENTSIFLKFVGQDIMKEERDTLDINKIDRKLAMGRVNQLARDWYIKLINDQPL